MTTATLLTIIGIEVFGGGGPMVEENGWNAQGGVGLRVILPISVFAQLHHAQVDVGGGALPRTDKTTAWLAGARLGLLPGPLSPYVLAAYGRASYRSSRGARDDGRTLHLGGGLQLTLAPSAQLFAEGRFTVAENEHADGADLGVPLAVGVRWRP
jgi:hypothetical protein